MPGPDAATLITVWGQGARLSPAARALYLAGLAEPAVDLDGATLALRDRQLARLRLRWFGPQVALIARCRSCHADFDLEIDISPQAAVSLGGPGLTGTYGDLQVPMRLPTADDLIAVAREPSPEQRGAALFRRCVESPVETAGIDRLREPAAECLLRFAHDVGQAIKLACGVCAATWTEYFDAAFLVWREIDRAARRLLDEVHRIALAYHWGEQEILALSPARRRFYLDAIG